MTVLRKPQPDPAEMLAYLAAAAARAMAAVRALAAAAAAAGICPFCGAMAAARAAGSPLYFLPVFLTAPRATRFCSFSYARRRSISSPPLAAFRARRFSCTISKSCLNSNEERLERTATSSSVTRSGTRRENAFLLRIAIRAQQKNFFQKLKYFFFVFVRKTKAGREGHTAGRLSPAD